MEPRVNKDNYKNIASTSRTPFQEESTLKINENRVENGELIKPVFNNQVMIAKKNGPNNKIDADTNCIVLQNPNMQLYNSFTNYSVCPFCKYSGPMIIKYKNSRKQLSYIVIMAASIICLMCSWIPLIVKDCADQLYVCPTCNEILQTLPPNRLY